MCWGGVRGSSGANAAHHIMLHWLMLPGERTAAVCLLEGSTLVEPTGFGRSLREDGRDSKFDLTGWRCSAHLDLTRNLWMDDGRKRWQGAAGENCAQFCGKTAPLPCFEL